MMKRVFCLVAATAAVVSGFAAEPLAPAEFEPLPAGSIRPEGWLGRNLDMQADGLIGHLYETSPYLCPSNMWLKHASGTRHCWEEGPCWARTFVKLAVLTRNDRLLKVAEKWMRAQADQQLPDGWYGRAPGSRNSPRGPEIFTHIIMNEAILTWYEYTKDPRYLDLLRRFIDFLDALPESALMSYNNKAAPKLESNPQDWEQALQGKETTPEHYYWHRIRGGDFFKVLFKVYALTKDERCLSLADKVFRKTMAGGRLWEHETGYSTMWCNIHTVNFAERFPYGTVYWRRSGNAAHRAMGDYWYDLHMQMWGQMPRGAYAAGEQIRAGKTDPNQSFETCSVSELTRSFCLVGGVTGERKWGDRAEDIVFNYAPLCYTPDWKKVHYLNAPNMVNLDVLTVHDYYNGGGHIAYSAHAYRCCLHNGGLSLPMFAENLVQRGKGGEMVLFLYAPHSGTAEFGGGKASWRMETRYPFREKAILSLTAEKPFALRLRVPAWCRAFKVNESVCEDADGWVDCKVRAGQNRFVVAMKADCEFRVYPRNGGVSVDRGPLTYSLALGETVRETPKKDHWTGGMNPPDMKTEYLVATPWNYALDVNAPLAFRQLDYHDECFAASNACCEIVVRGKRAPEWELNCNQPGDIPFMPVAGEGDMVDLRFVPMACQRCHVTVFPQLAAPGQALAVTPPKVVARRLCNRWSFKSSLADRVTGRKAERTKYLSLGPDVLPKDAATVEIWFTRRSYRRHAKLFAAGCSLDDSLLVSMDGVDETTGMSVNLGRKTVLTGLGRVEDGKPYHMALAVTAPNGTGRSRLVCTLTDAATGQRVATASCWTEQPWSLADLTQKTVALGWGSWWGNLDADLTVDECRIWQGAFRDEEIAASVKAGPDDVRP